MHGSFERFEDQNEKLFREYGNFAVDSPTADGASARETHRRCG
jgi:hypothetical protein